MYKNSLAQFYVVIPILMHCSPQNAKELFNLRHASLRNVIERVFGVLKKRFPMLVIAPMYPIKVQVAMFLAMVVIHNFIRMTGRADDDIVGEYDRETHNDLVDVEQEVSFNTSIIVTPAEKAAADAIRDRIADQMWIAYQREWRRRNL